jgi:hypothetical protein
MKRVESSARVSGCTEVFEALQGLIFGTSLVLEVNSPK